MKKIVVVLVSLVVAVLIGVGNAFAQDETPEASIPEPSLSSEWKLVSRDSDGSTVYVNTKRITYLPEGIVEVPTLLVPRGEFRRGLVFGLKILLLLKGKDPNNAERLWYKIDLYKFNCKTHQFAPLEEIDYSFEKVDFYYDSFQHEKWKNIPPGSPGEIVEKYVCNETSPSIPPPHKPPIPEPSLSSEWKPVGMYSDGTTFYINTRKITYLPKGIVKVRTLWVPRGELREEEVNILKKNLTSEGEDPNNAKRLWYTKVLYKINCKNHQIAPLELVDYSFGKAVLHSHSSQHEKWDNIILGSPEGVVEKYVCNEAPPSIPEPSLSSEWKLVARDSDGTTFYVDTRSITHLPGGIVKVRVLWVPRGGMRRGAVSLLKIFLLSEKKDPNNAERFWYYIQSYKVNCKTHQITGLEATAYSFGKAVLDYEPVQHGGWGWADISPGSPEEAVEKYVCNETSPSISAQYKQSIPEPSLGPEWEAVARNSNNGTTYYFNTRKVTYLPGGIVEVWGLMVPRGELRRTLVNDLKKILLYEGKNPNDAERLWYVISLHKLNCKTHQFVQLEITEYSFGQAVLYDASVQHEKWDYILPGSAEDIVEKYVCK